MDDISIADSVGRWVRARRKHRGALSHGEVCQAVEGLHGVVARLTNDAQGNILATTGLRSRLFAFCGTFSGVAVDAAGDTTSVAFTFFLINLV
jgi:hypothetical protein